MVFLPLNPYRDLTLSSKSSPGNFLPMSPAGSLVASKSGKFFYLIRKSVVLFLDLLSQSSNFLDHHYLCLLPWYPHLNPKPFKGPWWFRITARPLFSPLYPSHLSTNHSAALFYSISQTVRILDLLSNTLFHWNILA